MTNNVDESQRHYTEWKKAEMSPCSVTLVRWNSRKDKFNI